MGPYAVEAGVVVVTRLVKWYVTFPFGTGGTGCSCGVRIDVRMWAEEVLKVLHAR